MLGHRPARIALGAALAVLLAIPLELLLGGRGDSVRVLVLCGLAMVLAVAAPRLKHRRAAVDLALGALITSAAVPFPGPWVAIMAGVAAGLGLVGLVLARFGRRGAVGLVLALVVGSGVAWQQAGVRGVELPVHTWNQYHYVLGTKYYPELGSHDLYLATLLVDQDSVHRLDGLQRVRSMHDYQMMDRQAALAQAAERGVRERFSDGRWAELQHDWAVFADMRSARAWQGVLTDLGTNASPVWVAIYRPLLESIELDRRALEGLALLQLPMFAATIAAAVWGFGLRSSLWLVLWTVLFFGNRGRLYGGLFSYDWYALVVVAAALVARRRVLAAPLVATVGLMRGFGGLLAIGPTVQWLHRLWRDRRPDPWTTRFLVVLALSMGLLFAGSLAAGRGVEGWVDWLDKIELHSSRISIGGRHLGLKVLFGEDWSQPGYTARYGDRQAAYARQATAYHLAQLLLLGWTAWVVRRRSRLDGALLGLIPAFSFMVLSRYYYSAWAVMLLLGTTDEDRDGRPVVQLAMLSIIVLHDGLRFVDGTTADSRHQAVNLWLAILAVLTLLTWTVRDLRQPGAELGASPGSA